MIKTLTRHGNSLALIIEKPRLDREKNGLLKAMDHFNLPEGTIVTFAQSGEEEIDGKTIRMVPFYRWAWE